MLRTFLGGCCMCMQLQAFTQQFNARHDLFGEGEAEFGFGVEIVSDTSAIAIFNREYNLDGLYYSSGASSVLVSSNGVFTGGFRLHIPERANYVGWANPGGPRAEGGFIIGGSTYAAGDTNRVALYWMDDQGGITDYRELDLPGRSWIGRQAKQTPDGSYVVCGETSTVGVIDAFLLKTDALGEVEWVETYGAGTGDYAMAVDMDGDEGYFLGGQQRVSATNKQLWVQALNDTGGVVWDKVWGTVWDEPNAHLATAADGHILVASAWGTAPNDNYAKYMAKLDRSDGTIIWEETYGGTCQSCPLYAVKEVEPNGDLIAAGHTFGNSTYYGVLLRTTSGGDSLWMRNYQYDDGQVSNGRGLLRDVQPTPDGGFIAVGVALGVAGFYGQDVWVVKVDSMGCLEPGCDTVMGITTQITNLRGALVVAPNPVLSGSNVHVALDLPRGFVPQGTLRITITDAQGRLVRKEHFTSSSTTLSLQTAGMPAGSYHLHLSDNTRWISGAKLILE